MRFRAHTNASTRHAHRKSRGALSACLALVFACVIGGFALFQAPALQSDPQELLETAEEALHADELLEVPEADAAETADAVVLDMSKAYEPDQVLVSVDAGVDIATVNQALAELDFVQTKAVTSADLESGLLRVDLVPGSDVEDSVRALTLRGLRTQPNYVYRVADDDPLALALQAASSDDGYVPQEAVAINDPFSASTVPNAANRWALDSTYAPLAWGIERCGLNDDGSAKTDRVSVMVVDTGVRVDHIDLRDNVVASFNSVTQTEGLTEVADDTESHGTHVAGIVAGKANNGKGVAGLSYDAGLVAVKAAFKESGSNSNQFNTTTLANAYDWLFADSAADPSKSNAELYNVRVVNLSLGGPQKVNFVADDALTRKIKAAAEGSYRSGTQKDSILTVAAAGNSVAKYADGSTCKLPYINYPSDFSHCLAVIALTRKNGWSATNNVVERYSSSNYNVDATHIKNISAPGASIYSTINENNQYTTKSGTSMASPVAAGIAALVFSENPALSSTDATKIIEATATDLGTKGWDRDTGYGEINAYHAVQIASAKLDGNEQIEYKQNESYKLSYGDGTGWETYGSPNDWAWKVSDPSIATIVVDADANEISFTGIAAGTVTLTGTFKDMEGVEVPGVSVSKTITVMPLDIAKASIVIEDDCAYTGQPHTPKPTVTITGNELVEGVDYTTSYADNVDIGTATITITGLGNAAGTKMSTFPITEANIDDAILAGLPGVPYTGFAYEPKPEVTLAGFGQLEEGKDFTYEYADNVNAGQAKVRVNGKGGFKGSSQWLVFQIMPVNLNISTLSPIDPVTYTGSAIEPVPSVTLPDGTVLTKDVDYELSYGDNVDASTQATVTAKGLNNYVGSASTSFTIEPYDIADASIAGMDASYVFTGVAIEPEVSVSLATMGTLDGSEHVVSYSDNLEVGTATITATGTGNYKGTATASFDITPADLTIAKVDNIPDQIYLGTPVKPVPTVKLNGVELVADRDFTLSYENNTAMGSIATITITGKNNTTGTITKNFKIDLPLSTDMVSAIADQPYTGSAIEPGITVATTGAVLKRNENYSVEFANNVNVGTATVKITGIKGCAGETTATFNIVPVSLAHAAIAPVGSQPYTGNPITPTPAVSLYGFGDLKAGADFDYEYRFNTDAGAAQLRIVGKGNFKGETNWLDCSFEITKRDISAATISIPAQIYSGAALTPDPVVKVGGRTLTKGIDYRVSYYNNLETGTATAVVEGRGNYKGSKESQFQINETIVPEMIAVSETPTYDGKAHTPSIIVRDRGKTLVAGEDYEIEGYSDNVNAGTASITVAGKGYYHGKTVKTFTINPLSLADASVTVAAQSHTGSALTPNPTVRLDGFGTLTKDVDYTLEYASNVNVGTASVTVHGTGNYTGSKRVSFAIVDSDVEGDGISVKMQRLYNPNSGEHFYTASANERDSLVASGWIYEGYGWTAPVTSNTPVYRLYNSIAGDHHYTTDAAERAGLLAIGWTDEGIGWYSDDEQRVPLYRQYNANAASGSHNYTTDLDEHLGLIALGWVDEGVAWHGM